MAWTRPQALQRRGIVRLRWQQEALVHLLRDPDDGVRRGDVLGLNLSIDFKGGQSSLFRPG